MFGFLKGLFSSKKKGPSSNEIDVALHKFHHRHSQFETKGCCSKREHLKLVKEDSTTDEPLDVVETVISVEAASSLLDSITDCNDIHTESSDWSGNGGGFSGGGASDEW